MKKLVLSVTVLGALMVCSCDKSEEEVDVSTPVDLKEDNYSMLEVGNYWVYKNYTKIFDRVTNRDNDTVRVTKDTLINGETYFVLEGDTGFSNHSSRKQYLRDSSGYLISSKGDVFLHESNFGEVIYKGINIDEDHGGGETVYTEYEMVLDTTKTEVEAGSFETISVRGFTTDEIRDREYNCLNTFYAKGVGKVKETWCYYSYPDSSLIVKELIDYYVK